MPDGEVWDAGSVPRGGDRHRELAEVLMAPLSAGLLMVRRGDHGLEFLLAHPGGPFFARRDDGAWTVPKGLVDPGETLLEAARREFVEETGFHVPEHGLHDLGQIRMKRGKVVSAWAFLGDADPAALHSNTFELVWPRGSTRVRVFPEVDRVAWFDLATARRKILEAQAPLLDRAAAIFGS